MNSINVPSGLFCLVLPVLFCLIPLIAVGLFVAVGRRQPAQPISGRVGVARQGERNIVNRIILPNPATVQREFERLRARYPDAAPNLLVKRVIDKAAFNAGFIGFVTGAPGLPAMPVTVPIDFLATGRIQAAMIQTIAYAHGHDEDGDDEATSAKKTYMIMVGGAEAMAAVNRLIMQLILRIVGKSVFEVIPILGGFVGFGVNYYLTKSIGNVAIRHYTGGLRLADAGQTVVKVVETTRNLAARQKDKMLPSREPPIQSATGTLPDMVLIGPRPTQPEGAHNHIDAPNIAREASRAALSDVICPTCEGRSPSSYRYCATCGGSLNGDHSVQPLT